MKANQPTKSVWRTAEIVVRIAAAGNPALPGIAAGSSAACGHSGRAVQASGDLLSLLRCGPLSIRIHSGGSPLAQDTAACLGAFDGLHRGHQAVLERAGALAANVALVTFDPHPQAVLAPQRPLRLLHSPDQRARVLEDLGVDELVLLPFDHALAKLSPEAFVRAVLLEGLRPRVVVVGADFRFGAQRVGDAEALRKMLTIAGVGFEAVALRTETAIGDATKFSSTDIRDALDDGDVAQAAALLGRFHAVAGTVVHGAKRGREIGYPTANLASSGGLVPPVGIYASALSVWDRSSPDYGTCWPAVTSIGTNPTFTGPDAAVTIETYVLGRDLGERLYDVAVEVSFVERLRGEQRFDGVAPLVQQIGKDVEQARALVGDDVLQRVLKPRSAPGAQP